MEGLVSEERATQLQMNAISVQVNAAVQERESLRAYHDHLITRNIETKWLINKLERKKEELLRKVSLNFIPFRRLTNG